MTVRPSALIFRFGGDEIEAFFVSLVALSLLKKRFGHGIGVPTKAMVDDVR